MANKPQAGSNEPSMEEILSSIRKIISEDTEGQAQAAKAEPEEAEGEDEEVLDLTEEVAESDDSGLDALEDEGDDIADLDELADSLEAEAGGRDAGGDDALEEPDGNAQGRDDDGDDFGLELAPEEESEPALSEEESDAVGGFDEAGLDAAGLEDEDRADADADAEFGAMTEPEPEPESEPEPEPLALAADPDDDPEALPEGDTPVEDFGAPEEPAQAMPERDRTPDRSTVSDRTADAATSALAQLARSADAEEFGDNSPKSDSDRILERMVRDALEPHLKAWLDENLPDLVERIVREEVRRMTRRAEAIAADEGREE